MTPEVEGLAEGLSALYRAARRTPPRRCGPTSATSCPSSRPPSPPPPRSPRCTRTTSDVIDQADGRHGQRQESDGYVYASTKLRIAVNAVHFQAISAIIIAVVLGVILANDPYPTPEGAASFGGLNVYVFLGTMLGLIFVFLYIMVNLACIGYFWRQRRDEFNYIKHLLVPVLGVVAMIPAGLAVIGGVTIPLLDVTLDPYKNALRFAAPIVGIWMLIGVVLYSSCVPGAPRSLERMGDVYGGEAPSRPIPSD